MLEINDLNIEINHKMIIKNLNFVVNKNDKIAIIGEEGNGKSTLLKVINGDCNYASITGTINYKNNKIGYLEQFINEENLNKTAFEYLFKNQNDYYNKISNLYKNLKIINLKDEILEKKLINLSGGEKVKIQLLRLLLEENDILLLDEPTNDLDLDTLNWLEKFINESNKPIIYVSHDETLLSHTANTILHLELLMKKEEPIYTFLKIGYDDYVKQRLRNIEHTTQIAYNEKRVFKEKEDKLNQIMNKVEYQQATITRADPHGAKMLKRKMKSIKSQEKRMQNQELTKVPDYEENIHFFFEDIKIPIKKEIISLENEDLFINNELLLGNINLRVVGNEHIVIIGPNGIGKTTLLRKIYHIIKSRSDLKVGYMPQNYDEVLNLFETPIDFLCQTHDKDEISKVRSFLGNVKLTREEMVGNINDLSGGSKAKILLLKLVIEKYNVLLLDEPTRNVSPLSNPIIREVLKNYSGAIISISHDRKYIDICDSVYELTRNRLKLIKKNIT